MDRRDRTMTTDRREFFRIDDELSLSYKKIDAKQLSQPHPTSDSLLNNCSLTTALEMVSQESAVLLYRIDKALPEVAEYLKIIDAKIDLLGQAIMMQGFHFNESDTRNVNISATGVAFSCEEVFKKGDFLEIKILLASSMSVIVTYSRVINCRHNPHHNPQYPYFIGVDFIDIREEDREILIKYVIKKQLQQIRDNKSVVSQ